MHIVKKETTQICETLPVTFFFTAPTPLRYAASSYLLGDLVYNVNPFYHPAKNGMHTVQMGLRAVADKKLAASRILTPMGHGKASAQMFVRVIFHFALDGIAGPPGTGAVRAPALNDKVGNNPVKSQPIVKTVPNKFLKVSHCSRCVFFKQLRKLWSFFRFTTAFFKHHLLCPSTNYTPITQEKIRTYQRGGKISFNSQAMASAARLWNAYPPGVFLFRGDESNLTAPPDGAAAQNRKFAPDTLIFPLQAVHQLRLNIIGQLFSLADLI